MILSLFDFDGTITTDDSLIKFIRFVVGDIKAAWGMFLLSPMLITYKLKIYSAILNSYGKKEI
jgi:2-hydroxy-3-keto-5-methylthiopentenyl-1-phosphate phosphatase